MISQEDIKSFQDLYRKTFGKDIDDEEAYVQASNLIQMVRAVYKPMTKAEMKTVTRRRQETNN